MARPKTYDSALRSRLLDRAGELVSANGVAALSLRKLAADADTSTTAVYSLFGGKPALLRELYTEAFDRLGTRLRTVPTTGDPTEDLVQLGLAYRSSALADPHLYDIMFGGAIPDFDPGEDAATTAVAALAPLRDTITDGIASGTFTADPQAMTMACWGLVHGLVSLELTGTLPPIPDPASMYESALRANVSGWRTP